MLSTLRFLILPTLSVCGPVLLWTALLVALPLGISYLEKDGMTESFLICFGITFAAGTLLTLFTRRWKRELTARNGFLLVSLIWTGVPLFAAVPFLLVMPEKSFAEIYFEMMSCLTTTGATVLTGLDDLPFSLNFWRCFLSWIGGMGIIVLSVAVLPLLGVGGAQVLKAETSGPLKENRLTPRIADTAKALYVIYLGLSLLCAAAYRIAGMSWNDAVMHMMTTISLSGIAAHDASFAYFDSIEVDLTAVAFMLVSGFNFSLHFIAWKNRNILTYLRNEEARSWLFAMTLLTALTAGVLYLRGFYPDWTETLRYAAFSVVSVASTTGFATTDYTLWPLGLSLFMMLWAAFATCAGSTGGGVKMIRLLIALRMLRRELVRLVHPNAAVPVIVNRSPVDGRIAVAVLVYLAVWAMTFFGGSAALLLTGMPPAEALSASWAMVTNIGPGLGAVGPVGNYSGLTDPQLGVCTFLMLLGRLELFTVFVLFTKSFWRV